MHHKAKRSVVANPSMVMAIDPTRTMVPIVTSRMVSAVRM
jgi:hypothetical protein